MTDVKSKFTLHTQYKDFVPGYNKTEFPFEVLSPHLTSSKGCVAGVIAVAVAAMFGVCMGLSALLMFASDQQYFHEGLEVVAIVTTCEMEREGRSGKRPGIMYTYTVSEIVYEGHDRMEGRCENYPIGMELKAIYLRSNPSESRISQTSLTERGSESVLMKGGFILSSAFLLYCAWITMCYVNRYLYARYNRKYLATNGILLEGEIVSIWGHKPYKSNDYYVCVRYRFETPRKKILSGYAEAHRQDLKDKTLPPVGTPIAVLYADERSHMML